MRVHNVITDPCIIDCGCMYNGVPTTAAFPPLGSGAVISGDSRLITSCSLPLSIFYSKILHSYHKMSSKLDYISDTWKDGIFGTPSHPQLPVMHH